MLSEFCITQKGESHIKHGMPCQDFSDSFSVPETGEAKYVVAIVADGVGSEDFSDKGSQTAVTTVGNYIKSALEGDEPIESMTELIEDAFEEALDAVLDLAGEMQEAFSRFATTLTAGIFDGSTLWFGHAGDDGIVVMRQDGSYGMVTERQEGEEASSVVPFGVHNWQFGEVEGVASCVLMTDGVLDYCVKDVLEGNRVYLPFLQPLLYAELDSKEKVDTTRNSWDRYLAVSPEKAVDPFGRKANYVFRDSVRDDISIALLSNSEMVAQLPEYSFDVDAWNAETERCIALREERLAEITRAREENDSVFRELLRRGRMFVARDNHQEPETLPQEAAKPEGAVSENEEPDNGSAPEPPKDLEPQVISEEAAGDTTGDTASDTTDDTAGDTVDDATGDTAGDTADDVSTTQAPVSQASATDCSS